MKVLSVVALAALLGAASAACPNACSGNGDCATNYDYCECYTGYMGNDCSQRICQFGTAYVDSPVGDLSYDNTLNQGARANNLGTPPSGVPASTSLNPQFERDGYWERHPAQLWGTNGQSANFDGYVRAQEGHFYYECSNRGLCDRETGQCQCFTGYEGAACNRTVCANDCSGHGTCESMTELTPSHLYYDLWDSDKTMQCKCDAGYGGVDCSKRRCMKNDDPLTITATTVDYNDGIAEANEIQVVEVRCPYGGTIKDPSISLSYTDVQFDDTYETVAFDFTATNAGTLAANALKGLPNEVLADYTQDGVTLVQKVVAVSAETLELDQYYRLKVTFHHHMGNVPMMQVNPKFTCKAGPKVNPKAGIRPGVENINVQLIGDGPSSYVKVKFTQFTVGGAGVSDTLKWQVFDASNNFLGSASQTLTDSNATLTGAGPISREASKFSFEMSGGAKAIDHYGLDVRTDVGYEIEFIVDPVATVGLDMFTLAANPRPRSAITTPDLVNVVRQYDHNVVNATLGQWTGTPTYDMKVRFEAAALNTTGDNGGTPSFWYVYINNEYLFVTDDMTTQRRVSVSTRRDAAVSSNMVPNQFSLMSGTFEVNPGDKYAIGDYFQFWLPKTPIVRQAVQQESFTWSFVGDQPPAVGVKVAIKIVSTSTAVDTYAWKVVGDPSYQDNSGAGFAILDQAHDMVFGNMNNYVTVQYPDDPEHQAVQYIRVKWNSGVDYDQRMCNRDANNNQDKYYVWFGTEGINDSPVCSDRGICDETSGVCQCFAGYAGIDCTTMNALSF